MIYSIAFHQDKLIINTGDDINRIKVEQVMSIAANKASKYNLEFRIFKKYAIILV